MASTACCYSLSCAIYVRHFNRSRALTSLHIFDIIGFPDDAWDKTAGSESEPSPFNWEVAVQTWRSNRTSRPQIATADEIRNQATTGIFHLLANQMQFNRRHLKELLGVLLWKYTEAEGKYKTRYISRRAYEIIYGGAGTPEDFKKLRHEHVWERDLLIETLLANPSEALQILKSAISCTVTAEESIALTLATHAVKSGDRWERYHKAGVEVIDMASS